MSKETNKEIFKLLQSKPLYSKPFRSIAVKLFLFSFAFAPSLQLASDVAQAASPKIRIKPKIVIKVGPKKYAPKVRVRNRVSVKPRIKLKPKTQVKVKPRVKTRQQVAKPRLRVKRRLVAKPTKKPITGTRSSKPLLRPTTKMVIKPAQGKRRPKVGVAVIKAPKSRRNTVSMVPVKRTSNRFIQSKSKSGKRKGTAGSKPLLWVGTVLITTTTGGNSNRSANNARTVGPTAAPAGGNANRSASQSTQKW